MECLGRKKQIVKERLDIFFLKEVPQPEKLNQFVSLFRTRRLLEFAIENSEKFKWKDLKKKKNPSRIHDTDIRDVG